jgi:RNA-directed DNA polymerase
MTEHGDLQASVTGTPQGGILSPLLANIALSALDDDFARAWATMGANSGQRQRRRQHGEATYRLVRYADDFVILVAGKRRHADALVTYTRRLIAPLGLALSAEKTRVVHIDEGFEFLGFAIKRCRGRHGRRHVYTYPSKPSLQAVKAKVKAITRTGHDQTLDQLLHRLNPVLRGSCAYFRPGVSSSTFQYLSKIAWYKVTKWIRRKHRRMTWKELRRRYCGGGWWPTTATGQLFDPGRVRVTRYRYRGTAIPTPWTTAA